MPALPGEDIRLAIPADLHDNLPALDASPDDIDRKDERMRIKAADKAQAKGWLCGPWDSDLGISVGFANKGVDEPHVHRQMTEVYFMARGTATMRVEQDTIELVQDQVLVIEPGEAHTFLSSSPDHFHFVIQTPGLYGEAARVDKVPVSRSRLGL